MLNPNFVLLGVVISFAGSLSYLIDTVKGKVKPNRVSFLLWGVVPMIAFFAEINKGVGIQSLTTLMVGLMPILILLASFANRKAEWKLGTFDYICGGLAILSLVLWYITQEGNIAIALSIFADGLAALPTIVKSYYFPETENFYAYLTTIIASGITLLTITSWNFAHYGFPFYLLIVNLIIFSLVKFKFGKYYSCS